MIKKKLIMALSIESNNIFETWSIPLASNTDPQWKDNSWLVEHLRQLADKIENVDPQIYTFSIEASSQYGPSFCVKSFKK